MFIDAARCLSPPPKEGCDANDDDDGTAAFTYRAQQ